MLVNPIATLLAAAEPYWEPHWDPHWAPHSNHHSSHHGMGCDIPLKTHPCHTRGGMGSKASILSPPIPFRSLNPWTTRGLRGPRGIEAGIVHTDSIQYAPASRLPNVLDQVRALAFFTRLIHLLIYKQVGHILLACLSQPVVPVNALSPSEGDIHIILHCKEITFNPPFFCRISKLYLLDAVISFRSLVWRRITYIKKPKQRRNKLINHHQCNRFPNTTSRAMPESEIRSFHPSDTLLERSGIFIITLQPAVRVEDRSVRAKHFG